MSLKEDWISSDKLTWSNMNDILSMLKNIDNRLAITYPFGEKIKRNIQVGDDLSRKTLYLEFPNSLYDNIVNDVGGGQANILVTDQNNSLIEYVNVSNSIATVSKNSWMDMLYYADIDTHEVFLNETTVTLDDNFGVVTQINNLSALQYIFIEEEELEYKKGDFLISEILQNLENNLEQIANIINTSFDKRDWYYLSVITFEDVKRWSILLNIAYEEIFAINKNIITEDEEYLTTEDSDYLITEGS